MPYKHILLIGNAAPVPPRLLGTLARQADFVLAVDGGADKALQAGLQPHAVIGDLDTVSPRAQAQLATRLVRVPSQENTDLEKALHYALCTQHAKRLTLVGFVGDRWDFTVGNLLTLVKYARQADLCAVTEHWHIYPLVKNAQLPCQKHKKFSLVPVKVCDGVGLCGCAYALDNARLCPGTTRTLSNQTTATRVRVTLTRGALLAFVEQ